MNSDSIQKRSPYKIAAKIILVTLLVFVCIISAAIALIFIYENDIKKVILAELNKNLNAEVKINPENIQLTFIRTFPDCSIQFKEVLILEALPIKNRDTLLFAGQLSLHFNALNIWNKKYVIQKIKLSDAYANLTVFKNGKNNYTFWKSNPNSTSNDSVNFKLNLFTINNCKVKYKNKAQGFKTEFNIKELSFNGQFEQEKYDLESEAKLEIVNIAERKNTILKNKELKLNLELAVNGNNYKLKKAILKLNEMNLDLNGDFIYKDSLQNINLNFKAPDLDIQSTLSLLPEKYRTQIKDYESTGNFFAEGKLSFQSTNDYLFSSSFGIKNGEITYSPKNTKVQEVNLIGQMELKPKASYLKINSFSMKLFKDEMQGQLFIQNFSNPFLQLNTTANVNLKNLQNFWPIDTISSIEGSLKLKMEAQGLVSDFQKEIFSNKVQLTVDAAIDSLQVQFKNDEKLYQIETASITVRDQDVKVHDLQFKRGESDLRINGTIPGLLASITNSSNPLIIDGNLFSNKIVMEDFLPKANGSVSESPLIPANIEFKLNVAILKYSFGKFESKNITGSVDCKNQKVFVDDVKLETCKGEVELDAFADNSKNKLDVVLQSHFKNINISSLFKQFNNFGQSSLEDINIKGIASSTIDFSGTWNNKLEVNENSIKTVCNLNIDQGELIDYKPLMNLSDYVDIKELKHIKFSTLQSKIDIKNRLITIPQTSIKNSVLNIDVWGSQTFDYKIDYHIQLLIDEYLSKKRKNKDDEFGPLENDPTNRRSAFILMTGTLDHPIIKYDKKGLKQKVKADLKAEKQNIKQIFNEEFGIFRRDSLKIQKQKKVESVFELEKADRKKSVPVKKEDDDEDF